MSLKLKVEAGNAEGFKLLAYLNKRCYGAAIDSQQIFSYLWEPISHCIEEDHFDIPGISPVV